MSDKITSNSNLKERIKYVNKIVATWPKWKRDLLGYSIRKRGGDAMTEELSQALKHLRDIVQKESHSHCVSVEIFINHEGYKVELTLRTPGSLQREGISMRNLNGEWIC